MAFLTRPCRDITALVLAAEDRRLTLRERIAVRVHLGMCRACNRFVRQVDLMRGALERWRHYREDDEPALDGREPLA